MSNKRTNSDWSRHQLTIEEFPDARMTVHRFARPDSGHFAVEFINVRGVLVVKGDLGNWMFCRSFMPSADAEFCDTGYWLEKLRSNSCQQPSKYDAEYTAAAIRERIDDLEDYYGSEERRDRAKEYYEECLQAVDSEHEYVYTAMQYPSFMDSESIIFEKKALGQILCVMDAYDEIILRLKAERDEKA